MGAGWLRLFFLRFEIRGRSLFERFNQNLEAVLSWCWRWWRWRRRWCCWRRRGNLLLWVAGKGGSCSLCAMMSDTYRVGGSVGLLSHCLSFSLSLSLLSNSLSLSSLSLSHSPSLIFLITFPEWGCMCANMNWFIQTTKKHILFVSHLLSLLGICLPSPSISFIFYLSLTSSLSSPSLPLSLLLFLTPFSVSLFLSQWMSWKLTHVLGTHWLTQTPIYIYVHTHTHTFFSLVLSLSNSFVCWLSFVSILCLPVTIVQVTVEIKPFQAGLFIPSLTFSLSLPLLSLPFSHPPSWKVGMWARIDLAVGIEVSVSRSFVLDREGHSCRGLHSPDESCRHSLLSLSLSLLISPSPSLSRSLSLLHTPPSPSLSLAALNMGQASALSSLNLSDWLLPRSKVVVMVTQTGPREWTSLSCECVNAAADCHPTY